MYRFAVLTYCNAAPLVHFLEDFCGHGQFVRSIPKQMLGPLKSGEVDVALLPTFDFLTTPGLKMVQGLGICADGPVESVLLQSRYPIDQIRSIKLSPESRTSNMLVQVLLRQRHPSFGHIRFVYDGPSCDASVVIGDSALRAEASPYTYDLSDMWQAMTGLPFVFAVWAYPDDRAAGRLGSILRRTKEKGCQNIEQLSELHAARLRLSPAYVRHYLADCLKYDVGDRETEAIRTFQALLASPQTDRKAWQMNHTWKIAQ